MKESLYIIKVGGNIIDDESKLNIFLQAFSRFEGKKILIHGGGKLATRLAADLQIPQQMIDGRRITDAETLKIVTMVYAGYINKNIVARLHALSAPSIGICGADADVIRAHKRKHADIDYGYVGDIDQVNSDALNGLLQEGLAVVIAPITHDGNGQLLNTNADTIAQEVAIAMSALYKTTLVYSFEKEGVLLDADDNSTLIPEIDSGYFHQLKEEKKIFAGMIPKLDNAFKALRDGLDKVIIGPAEKLDDLIAGNTGTRIVSAKDRT